MAKIPTKPVLSFTQKELTTQALGFCMELMRVRYNKVDIFNMLSSGGLTDLQQVHAAWTKVGGVSQTPACASRLRSRLDDGLYHLLGNLGAALFGELGRAAAMEKALGSCVGTAIKTCNAPVVRWEQQAAEIRAAPQISLKECQDNQRLLPHEQERLAQLESDVRRFEADLKQNQDVVQALPDRIPLSQALCVR